MNNICGLKMKIIIGKNKLTSTNRLVTARLGRRNRVQQLPPESCPQLRKEKN
jgi:hypothetical protein